MSRVYHPSHLPRGTSWVYKLNAQDAILQCQVFGLQPAATLDLNRPLLCGFLRTLDINGGAFPPPQNCRPDVDFNRPDGVAPPDPFESLRPEQLAAPSPPPLSQSLSPQSTYLPPPARSGQPAALGDVSHLISLLSQQQPVQPSPDWSNIMSQAASSIASAIQSVLAPSRDSVPASAPSVVRGLIDALPVTSGDDSVRLVRFLVNIQQTLDMGVALERDVIIGVLPKTADELRTLWVRAVADHMSWKQLVQSILDFFVPARLRDGLRQQLVYRAQGRSESLMSFVHDVQACAALLAPNLQDRDILDVVLDGMLDQTRLRLSGLPACSSLQDLKGLIPRLAVMESLRPTAVQQQSPSQPSPPYRDPARVANHQTNSHSERRTYFTPPRYSSFRHPPPPRPHTNAYGAPYAMRVPDYPFHRYSGPPRAEQYSPRQYSGGHGRTPPPRAQGQGNYREGR